MDGSVAFLDFSQDELGDPLSEEEKVLGTLRINVIVHSVLRS